MDRLCQLVGFVYRPQASSRENHFSDAKGADALFACRSSAQFLTCAAFIEPP